MKTYLYSLFFFFGFLIIMPHSLHSQEKDSVYTEKDSLDEMPQFPGSKEARLEFVREHLDYPRKARETGIEGTVFVSFIVETDGRITNVKVKKGIGSGCDEAAMNVVKNMPRWEPGKIDGEAVRVKFNLPFRFKLAGGSDNEGCGFFNFF